MQAYGEKATKIRKILLERAHWFEKELEGTQMANEDYCNTIAKRLYRNLEGRKAKARLDCNKSLFAYRHEAKPSKKRKSFQVSS